MLSSNPDDTLRRALSRLVHKNDLSYDEARVCIGALLDGNASDILKAAFLTAFSMKGESIDELRATLDVMLERSLKIRIDRYVVDTAGTGGDRIKTINVSTAAAFIAAASGACVAKHGNRAVSSVMGSADILEYLGYNLDTDADKIKECIEGIGIGFLFAPRFHTAMKVIADVRRRLGIRSIFNIVGPLSNPVNLSAQIVGVSSIDMLRKVAYILKDVREEVMVFHALDGMDELSNTCMNRVVWVKGGDIREFDLDPRSVGLNHARLEDIVVNDRDTAARIFLDLLNGYASSAIEDIAVLNASALLIVSKRADDFVYAIDTARDAVRSGRAYSKLYELIKECGNVERLKELDESRA
jgi:anthranilate phosphoribosyltransferase